MNVRRPDARKPEERKTLERRKKILRSLFKDLIVIYLKPPGWYNLKSAYANDFIKNNLVVSYIFK